MKRILVVDDEEKIRQIYSRLLKAEGYDVISASNAHETNDILLNKKIDLVLLDIKMHDIDGSMLYEVIKMFHPGVRVIVSSVYPVDEQMRYVERADAYYDKSQGIDVLLGKIRTVIEDGFVPENSYC
jgi:DNA-binding NtrC family response regulator